MALDLNDRYPGKTEPPTAEYPFGAIRNVSSVGANDGTQLEQDWANDIFGFLQALLTTGGVLPSGLPDNVLASDYLTAILNILGENGNTVTKYQMITNADITGNWSSADHMKYVTFTNAGAITAVMDMATAPFGDTIVFEKGTGAGNISVVGNTGITIELISGGSNAIITERQVATMVSKSATVWKMII